METKAAAVPRYSVVAPIYNEESNIDELYGRLAEVSKSMDGPFEFLFVDDGSRDRSLEKLRALRQKDPRVKFLSFARNFGHQAAITAGIRTAAGEAVIVMDADLQDPPELLPELAKKWREGFQVVYAKRSKRSGETWCKLAAAGLYYRLLSRLSEIEIPCDTGDFCLMDRRVVDVLNAMPESGRYIRGLRAWAGFRQDEVVFDRPARFKGTTKYTLAKSVSLALAGLVSFSRRPLRLPLHLGWMAMLWGFFVGSLGARPVLGAVYFIGGVQLFCLGILGEYLGRIYDETRRRPLFVLKESGGMEGK